MAKFTNKKDRLLECYTKEWLDKNYVKIKE